MKDDFDSFEQTLRSICKNLPVEDTRVALDVRHMWQDFRQLRDDVQQEINNLKGELTMGED